MHPIVPIVYYYIGSECKERWESLRSQYRKNENKQKTKSGQAASNISSWKYASQMHFLKQFMKDRSRVTSMTAGDDSDEEKSDESTNECEIEANHNEQTNENNNEENVDEDVDKEVTQTSSLKTSKLRKKKPHTDTKESASTTLMKYLVQQKREEQSPHPTDTFFSLMATSVKKFNATDQHFVKTKLFSLVSDIEAKYIESQNRRNFQPEFIHGRSLQPSPALSQYSALSTSTSCNDDFGPNQQQINPIQSQPQVYPENTQTIARAFANDFNLFN